MTRVLMVEDHGLIAGAVQNLLVTQHHHEVARVDTPAKAIQQLKSSKEYDVVIVDLLFDPLTKRFEELRRGGKLTPTSKFLTSGLAVFKYLNQSRHPARPVLWSAADPSRQLHIIFSYEYLDVRIFCSKDSRTGTADNLNRAIRAAAAGQSYVDEAMNSSLPGRGVVRLGDRLMAGPHHLAIWQSLALGYHSREELKAVTGYSDRTIGNTISKMAKDGLHGLSRGNMSKRVALPRLADFACSNREFFLDETVRDEFR